MDFYLHEIITYILSYFIPSINKDLQLQKKILSKLSLDEDNLDFYKIKRYENVQI